MTRNQKLKIYILTLCTLFFLSIPQPSLAAEGREGGKKQTPFMIIVQVVLTAVTLRFIESKVMP